uniref:PHD-type domain-containing protein n=1 Tax=Bicosoecida sp. CB-2014 TaxID=1486930 RepID=A0A7S1G271_9STRA
MDDAGNGVGAGGGAEGAGADGSGGGGGGAGAGSAAPAPEALGRGMRVPSAIVDGSAAAINGAAGGTHIAVERPRSETFAGFLERRRLMAARADAAVRGADYGAAIGCNPLVSMDVVQSTVHRRAYRRGARTGSALAIRRSRRQRADSEATGEVSGDEPDADVEPVSYLPSNIKIRLHKVGEGLYQAVAVMTPAAIASKHIDGVLPQGSAMESPLRAAQARRQRASSFDDDVTLICDVCDSAVVPSGHNHIIVCEACTVAVHLDCYGLSKIPADPWYCQPCTVDRIDPIRAKTCRLCGGLNGAFVELPGSGWLHVACVLWVPHVSFTDATIQMVQAYDAARNLTQTVAGLKARQMGEVRRGTISMTKCSVCNVDMLPIGAVPCSHPGCAVEFHLPCARASGYVMTPERSPSSNGVFEVFCAAHSLPRILGDAGSVATGGAGAGSDAVTTPGVGGGGAGAGAGAADVAAASLAATESKFTVSPLGFRQDLSRASFMKALLAFRRETGRTHDVYGDAHGMLRVPMFASATPVDIYMLYLHVTCRGGSMRMTRRGWEQTCHRLMFRSNPDVARSIAGEISLLLVTYEKLLQPFERKHYDASRDRFDELHAARLRMEDEARAAAAFARSSGRHKATSSALSVASSRSKRSVHSAGSGPKTPAAQEEPPSPPTTPRSAPKPPVAAKAKAASKAGNGKAVRAPSKSRPATRKKSAHQSGKPHHHIVKRRSRKGSDTVTEEILPPPASDSDDDSGGEQAHVASSGTSVSSRPSSSSASSGSSASSASGSSSDSSDSSDMSDVDSVDGFVVESFDSSANLKTSEARDGLAGLAELALLEERSVAAGGGAGAGGGRAGSRGKRSAKGGSGERKSSAKSKASKPAGKGKGGKTAARSKSKGASKAKTKAKRFREDAAFRVKSKGKAPFDHAIFRNGSR